MEWGCHQCNAGFLHYSDISKWKVPLWLKHLKIPSLCVKLLTAIIGYWIAELTANIIQQCTVAQHSWGCHLTNNWRIFKYVLKYRQQAHVSMFLPKCMDEMNKYHDTRGGARFPFRDSKLYAPSRPICHVLVRILSLTGCPKHKL